jgi:hypothetical protein
MNLGIYIMAPEPLSKAYFMHLSQQSVCLYVYPPIVARQWLGKNITLATNANEIIEGMLGASFSMRSVSYQV